MAARYLLILSISLLYFPTTSIGAYPGEEMDSFKISSVVMQGLDKSSKVLGTFVSKLAAGSFNPGSMRPDDFWIHWDEEKRDKWIQKFKDEYGPDIEKSAKEQCIPKELLYSVIANEQLDYSIYEKFEEKIGLGSSVGVAQISVATATKDGGFVPFQDGGIMDRRRLSNKSTNIAVAAKMVKKYSNSLCDRYSEFTESFNRTTLTYLCDQSNYCITKSSKTCSEKVATDVPACVISGMTAVWNNGIEIITVEDIPKNAPNAHGHAIWSVDLNRVDWAKKSGKL